MTNRRIRSRSFIASEEKKKHPSESGSECSFSSGTTTHVLKRLKAAGQKASRSGNLCLPLVMSSEGTYVQRWENGVLSKREIFSG